jgi:hypothetical protein
MGEGVPSQDCALNALDEDCDTIFVVTRTKMSYGNKGDIAQENKGRYAGSDQYTHTPAMKSAISHSTVISRLCGPQCLGHLSPGMFADCRIIPAIKALRRNLETNLR